METQPWSGNFYKDRFLPDKTRIQNDQTTPFLVTTHPKERPRQVLDLPADGG